MEQREIEREARSEQQEELRHTPLGDGCIGAEADTGEQQEWAYYETHHGWLIYVLPSSENRIAIVESEETAKAVTIPHNAALAAAWTDHAARLRTREMEFQRVSKELSAQREKSKTFEKGFSASQDVIIKQGQALAAEQEKVTLAVQAAQIANKQLATERERREQHPQAVSSAALYDAFEENKQLRDQLLSALAAIKWSNRVNDHIIDADLSALHQHDEANRQEWLKSVDGLMAEVRKPLVEALIKLSKLSTHPVNEHDKAGWTGKIFCSAVKEICDDALAKIKNES